MNTEVFHERPMTIYKDKYNIKYFLAGTKYEAREEAGITLAKTIHNKFKDVFTDIGILRVCSHYRSKKKAKLIRNMYCCSYLKMS